MSINIKNRKRVAFVFISAIFVLFTLLLRLIWVQFIMGEDLRQKAYDARFRNVEVKAKRGIIYDAKGKPLAISVSTDSFYAIPAQVKKADKVDETALQLAQILNLDQTKVKELITKKQAFVWVQRHVPDELSRKIKDLKLEGISYVEEPERFYPKGKLLANVLGFSGIDNQGLSGMEVSYDKVLSGISGTIMVEYDARGQEIPDALQKYIPPQDGNSIILTIDETIQYILERELDEIMKLRNPQRAGAIVMEPKTGRILAMGSRPTFDPNQYKTFDQSTWRNFLVSDAYEPGSTFKTVVAAGALEEGVVSLSDRFYDPGYIKVGKETIKCWRHGRPHGSQSFIEAVQNSCNPVFVTIGLREGKEVFYRYLYGFGFGKKTGIELPGEATGILVNKERVKEIDLATMSIGQANAVTPIQLITAFSAIANDGYYMKPQLVKEIRDKEGNLVKTIEPEALRQVISQKTSKTLLEILETVVSEGTGSNAYVEGYRAGGKTGTAQKIKPGGGYSSNEYIASFLGVAPVNDPRLAVLVVVDSPQGIYYGGQVAAPAFKNIIRDTLRYLQVNAQVEPEIITNNKDKISVPNFVNTTAKDAAQKAVKLGLKVDTMGNGTQVKAQIPTAGSQLLLGGKVILYTSIPAGEGKPETVVVPDFTGKTVGDVKELVKMLNLNFELVGSGTVVRQDPEPGNQIPVGSKIMVYLEPQSQSSLGEISP